MKPDYKKINEQWEAQKAKWEKQYTKKDRKYILLRLKCFLPNLFADNYNRTKHPGLKRLYEEVSTFDWDRMAKEVSTDDLCLLYNSYDTDGCIYEDKTDYANGYYGWTKEELEEDFKPIPCKDPRAVDIALLFNYKTDLPF